MPFFGTTAFAAPGLGVISGLIMLILAWRGLNAERSRRGWRVRAMASTTTQLWRRAPRRWRVRTRDGFDIRDLTPDEEGREGLPSFPIAILPVLVVVAVNLAFIQFIALDSTHPILELPQFGETTLEAVRGLWSIILALVSAIVVLIATNWRRLPKLVDSLNEGANASVIPIANTASLWDLAA